MGFLDAADAENQVPFVVALSNLREREGDKEISSIALSASIVQTCNCLYALLQQRQRDIEFRDAANDQKQRLMSDMTRLEARLERQDAQLIAKERELAALTSKEQKAAAAHKVQLEKLQQERDEFQRMVVSTQKFILQQVRVQQSHELKKKEKEYAKLQEKLNQVLAEKKKETKPALEILTLLQKEGRQRGTWNTKKADGDFYKMIVDAYEAKKQELMAENTDLRSLLRSMQSDMRDFLNTHNGVGKATSVNGSFDLDRPSTPLAGRTDVFDLPFHMARDQIEQSLRTKMASIKERMMQLQESQQALRSNSEASDRELELEAQLVEARSIITEQVSLMNKQLTEDPRTSAPGHVIGKGAPAFFGADEGRVASSDWSTQLEAERSAIKKMTADLERERLEVEEAKERFQEEQASWARSVNLWIGRLGGAKDLPGKNDEWPENQIAQTEIASLGYEFSKNQAETQVSPVDAQMDRLGTQIVQPKAQTSRNGSIEDVAEKKTRHVDAQYGLSQSQAFQEKRSFSFADPRRVRRTKSLSEVPNWHEHRRTDIITPTDVSVFQKADLSSQAMGKEISSTSRSNSSRLHGKFVTSQETGSGGRSSRIYDYQKNSALGYGHYPETEANQGVGRDLTRTSHRRAGSNVDILTELTKHQSDRYLDRTDISKASPQEIRTESKRLLAEEQAEQSFKRAELARSWSSSRRNSEPRIHPDFHFIPDDAWVDDSQSVQTASEQDTQRNSLKGVHSQRSTTSTRVEPKKDGEPVRMSSRRMDVPSTSNGQKNKQKDQQASCGCFRVFTRSS
ncbi:hypothetical protein AXG93_3217s1250 [Marchantia polymorpha subsp. ruderalis]|uniref:Uncharacterized protein n=1 Tax=Marchantia polymorpha subsp. ruderalis TaxID=1480154 RepID=A0A176VWC8_MARPO|nr:hypothetical protein AXG93_3217s1250 [Marchantia polymorpha subsp. ruderalis]